MSNLPPVPPPPTEDNQQHLAHRASQTQPVDPPLYARYQILSPRTQYRRAKSRRKVIIFGFSILGLISAFSVGALGLMGVIPFPFESEFSRDVVYAELGDVPCPSTGARPGTPENVQLNILNTTSTPGLAGSTAEYFEQLGYQIAGTDNGPQYRGNVQIEAGPRGVDAAYTLARFLGSNVKIKLNATEDMTLTVLLGLDFEGVPGEEETEQILSSSFALVPLAGCLPVQEPADGWDLPERYQQSSQSGQSSESGQSEEDDQSSEDDS